AAKKRPFSIARKPMTCGTAFWRTIIMRKESSRRNAASTLTSSARSVIPTSAFHQEMSQHAEHGEQERGGQELRREEEAQLREQRLDQREAGAGECELARERSKSVRQRRPVAGVGDAPREEERDADGHVGEE